MDNIDKILSIVLDNQADMKDVKSRIGNIEDVQNKTFNKLDGFLSLIQKHEIEIAALRLAVSRLSERVDMLEKVK
ncbi:MAG: hypothetical protein KBD73_04195 [Candidatus Magasanikbacteria bacterium]|nr:hypothetical protein [Candidatus Magasanikbacteria bacterium]